MHNSVNLQQRVLYKTDRVSAHTVMQMQRGTQTTCILEISL